MKSVSISAGNAGSSRFQRIKRVCRSTSIVLGILVCLALPMRTLAEALVCGDIYVYTSPGVLTDVTAQYIEDPWVSINGIQVEIFPDTTNGNVYDANGDVLGFIYGVVQVPPS